MGFDHRCSTSWSTRNGSRPWVIRIISRNITFSSGKGDWEMGLGTRRGAKRGDWGEGKGMGACKQGRVF